MTPERPGQVTGEPEPDAVAKGWVLPPGGHRVDAIFVLSGTSLGIGRVERLSSPVWLDLREVQNLDALGDPVGELTEIEIRMYDGRVIGAGWTDDFCGAVIDALRSTDPAATPAPVSDPAATPAPVSEAVAPAPLPPAEAAVDQAATGVNPFAATPVAPASERAPSAEPAAESVPGPWGHSGASFDDNGGEVGAAPPPLPPVPQISEVAPVAAQPVPVAPFPGVPAQGAAPAPAVSPPAPAAMTRPGPLTAGSVAGSLELEDVVYLSGYPGQSKRRKKCVVTMGRSALELIGPNELQFRIGWDVVRSIEVQNADEARFRMNTKIHRDASALVLECDQGVTVLLEARDCPTVALRSAINQLLDGLPVVVV